MQYIPGGESPENTKVAETAIAGFQDVLQRSPGNPLALSSLASIYFNMKDLDEAKDWNMKLIQVDPDNKEAHYTIGVINWTKSYEPRTKLRAEVGMRMEDPGPIKDAEKRTELAEQTVPIIQEGIQMLEKALSIDPDYEDAMAYTNLLYREWADVATSSEEYEKYQTIADEWVQKTLDTKKRKAEEGTKDLFKPE
jgi:tetratricopeptide (TPR) repeat protein